MTVTSPQSVRVVVDGIQWIPVSSDGNTDTYSLTTGGRVTMFVGSRLEFSFKNEYDADFAISQTQVLFVTPGGNIRENTQGTYTQTTFPESYTQMSVSVFPQSMESIVGLEPSSNQEGVTLSASEQGNYIRIMVSGADVSQHLEVYLGNVLLSFITPANT